MADASGFSVALERGRDLIGRQFEPWVRRGVLVLFLALVVLALLNTFGQAPVDSRAAGPDAVVQVRAPERIRGGILFEGVFTVTARRDIKQPRLVLGAGWLDGFQINTIEPAATEESSRGKNLELTYDELKAGESMTLWMQFQVNPTTVGRRVQETALYDGERLLASERRPVTVWP